MQKPHLDLIEPFRQGQLDSLCGIYGIINSVRWGLRNNLPLTKHQSRLLYLRLVKYLEDRELLASAMDVGLCIPEISQLLHTTKEWLAERNILLKHSKPFHKQKTITTLEFLNRVTKTINRPNTSVLMATVGRLDHWTSVVGANKNRLLLFDSSGLRRIGTGTGDTLPPINSGKAIQFMPTGLFVLNFSPARGLPDSKKW